MFLGRIIKYSLNYLLILNLVQNNKLQIVFLSLWDKTILNFKKLNNYYLRNEHLWLDGFLFDFLQKKTADI